MKHSWVFVLALWGWLVLSGCTASSSILEQKEQAQEHLQTLIREAETNANRFKPLRHVAHFYVPEQANSVNQLGGQEDKHPISWYTEPAHFHVEAFPLKQLLFELVAELNVSIKFLDDIEPEQKITFRFEGLLGEAINQLAKLCGLFVQLDEQQVIFQKYEVAEFDVSFLAGETSFFLGEGSASNSSTKHTSMQLLNTSGLNDQDSEHFLNFKSESLSVWKDLTIALELLLSAQGKLAVNQSSTSVLVRDLPQHVDLVRKYLEQQNRRLTRQVAIDVQVIEVTFNDHAQKGIDWELISRNTAGTSVLNLFSQAGQTLNNQAYLGGAFYAQSSRFSGSKILIEALKQQGLVEVSNHPRVVTLNNQISKVILEDNVTYLASSGTSTTANVGSHDLLIPGVVRTGFELYLLPKIHQQQILLQLSTSLSDLQKIEQMTSGDKSIQTPQTTRKKFFMKALVNHQETLLISGLQNQRSQLLQEQSMFSWLLGGRHKKQVVYSETIVLLTPRILWE